MQISVGGQTPPILFGYEVLECIGRGAGSTLYAVRDRRTHQVYAMKHVVRRKPKDIRFLEQLVNEYTVCARFRHPGLRRCFLMRRKRNLFLSVKEAALLMELVNGKPIDEQPLPDVSAIIDCFILTARALHALHYMRYVHCDLKPGNIMMTNQGRVKLIDFGQACPIGTIKKRIQGTPDFIAPEQVKCQPVTVQTDIFSFGATLYWALTGSRVPTLYTVSKHQRNILTEQRYPSPGELNTEVPELLSKLVMRCVRMKATDRPETMGEVVEWMSPLSAHLKDDKENGAGQAGGDGQGNGGSA